MTIVWVIFILYLVCVSFDVGMEIGKDAGRQEGFQEGQDLIMTKVRQNAIYGYEIKRRKTI